MSDREDLLAQIKTYCEKRYPAMRPSSPDFPYGGHGNTKQVSAVVLLAVDWIEGDLKARETISWLPKQIDLANLTGMAVHELTRIHLSWAQACEIVKSAGETALWTGKLDKLVAKHPQAAERFLGMLFQTPLDDLGKNVKRVVQDLAKTVIWVQSYAFLVEHGYTMPAE